MGHACYFGADLFLSETGTAQWLSNPMKFVIIEFLLLYTDTTFRNLDLFLSLSNRPNCGGISLHFHLRKATYNFAKRCSLVLDCGESPSVTTTLRHSYLARHVSPVSLNYEYLVTSIVACWSRTRSLACTRRYGRPVSEVQCPQLLTGLRPTRSLFLGGFAGNSPRNLRYDYV